MAVYNKESWEKRKYSRGEGDDSPRGGLREMSVGEDCNNTRNRQREPIWRDPRARATHHGDNSTSYRDREHSSSIPRAQRAHHGGESDLVSGGAKSLAMGTVTTARVSAVEEMRTDIGDRRRDTEKQKRKRGEHDDDRRGGGDHGTGVRYGKHSDKNTRYRMWNPARPRAQGARCGEKSDSPSRGALRSLVMRKDTVARVPEAEKKIDSSEHQGKKLKTDERKHDECGSDHGTRVRFSKHRDNSTREKIEVDSGERHEDKKRKRDVHEDGRGGTRVRLIKHRDDSKREKSCQASGNDFKSLDLGPSDNARELAVKERKVDYFAQQDKERGQKSMGIEHDQYGGSTRSHIEERDRNKDRKLRDKGQKIEGQQSHNFVGGKDWDPGKRNEGLEPDKKKKLNDANKDSKQGKDLKQMEKEQGKVEAVKKKAKSSDADDEEITISDVEKSFAFEGRIVGKILTVADYSSSSDEESEDSAHKRQEKKRRQRQDKERRQRRDKRSNYSSSD